MDWDFTYILIHLAAIAGIVVLLRRVPDQLQVVFLLLALTAMVVYVGADIAALMGVKPVWPIRMVASRVEHTAVLLYIVRQCWIKTEICQFLTSLRSAGTSKS